MITVELVGPHLDDKGGVSTVIRNYRAAGLFQGAQDGLRVRYFASTRDGVLPFRAVYGAMRFVWFALRPRGFPNVVHLHTSWRGSTVRKCFYAWAGRLRGARVVFHIHPSRFYDFVDKQRSWFRRIVYATLRRADAIIVLTPEMQSATERRLRNVTVRILPNPVDPFIFEPVASVVRDSMHVAFIGRFAREKGVFDLLDATRRLIDQGSGVRVTLAGGKAEADVDAAIERLGLRQTVTFRNWLATHDVAELLRRCTMLALPSHTEGVPMVLLEALMCGTPIVTCPVGGIPLIVKDGRNGLLVPPGNFAALGIAIGRLLSSPELCREISINNIADSAQFRAESIVQDLRAIYARLSSVAGHVVSSS